MAFDPRDFEAIDWDDDEDEVAMRGSGTDMTEQERREAARASFGGDVMSAREVEPRVIKQMLSVRVEASLAVQLAEIAEERGMSLSNLLRQGMARLVEEHRERALRVETRVHIPPQNLPVLTAATTGTGSQISASTINVDGLASSVTAS